MVHGSLSLRILVVLVSCIGLWSGSALSQEAIVMIGNPGLAQFPNDSGEDSYARSVWDMHCYNGDVYVGVGDCWHNRGPIDVWSFGADGGFQNEYTVDEEQVSAFRDYEGSLLIPGVDATESWDYGNLYIKDNTGWRKLRTIPNGLHVYDVAVLEGNIYVAMKANGYYDVLESSDMGQEWISIMRAYWDDGKASFSRIVASNGSLFILGTTVNNEPCMRKYIDGNIETLALPNVMYNTKRFLAYKDGVLYVGNYDPDAIGTPSPLFFLNDFGKGVVAIEEFQWENVRDIVVRGDICYVLTASSGNGAVQGCIYSSSDLDNWIKLAEFSVSALPYSFEILDGVFYVGLGFPGAASGNIYRINNMLPSVSIDSFQGPDPYFVLPDQELTFSGTFTDPNRLDEHTAVWDFGDGTTEAGDIAVEGNATDVKTGTITGNHAYSVPGEYTVILTVEDGYGADTAQFTLNVEAIESAIPIIIQYIEGMQPADFAKPNQQRQICDLLAKTNMNSAVSKLNNVRGKVEKWVTNEADRNTIIAMVDSLIAYLETQSTTNKSKGGKKTAAPHASSMSLPEGTILAQNYPNPFNPETWIPYQLSEGSDVTIRIYSVSGRLIRDLNIGHRSAGFHMTMGKAAYWDGRDETGEHVASGVYFYVMNAGNFAAQRKMLIVR